MLDTLSDNLAAFHKAKQYDPAVMFVDIAHTETCHGCSYLLNLYLSKFESNQDVLKRVMWITIALVLWSTIQPHAITEET